MIDPIEQRLTRIESMLKALLDQKTVKDFYSTQEVAEIIGRSEYTVREWCRKQQVPAVKARNGRGWLLSQETLLRLRNGALPLPEYETQRSLNGFGKEVGIPPSRRGV